MASAESVDVGVRGGGGVTETAPRTCRFDETLARAGVSGGSVVGEDRGGGGVTVGGICWFNVTTWPKVGAPSFAFMPGEFSKRTLRKKGNVKSCE